jgi:hypothetical protein
MAITFGKDGGNGHKKPPKVIKLESKKHLQVPRERVGDHLWMIEHPDYWPHDVLPVLKRVPGKSKLDSEMGLIRRDNLTTVYIANLLMAPPISEAWEGLKKYTYPSVDALVADGWQVD